MRILVTGGTGLIGRYCIEGLADSGHEVVGVYSSGTPDSGSCSWHRANLLDESDRVNLIDQVRPDALIHLAWHVEDYDGGVHLDWLASSLHLIRCFQRLGGKLIFTAGSSMEYAWDGEVCSESESSFDSETLYGYAKYALWKTVSELCAREGLTHCHGRIFFICGMGQDHKRLVPSVINSVDADKKFICQSGYLYRDYLDVREVAKAINDLVLQQCSGDFNIASGVATKVEDIVKEITSQTGRSDLVEFPPSPSEKPKDLTVVADLEKLEAAIGYRPAFDLEKSIRETVQWLK